MRTFICICLSLVAVLFTSAAPDRNSNASPETRFKVRYHRWVAAIYDRPGTLLYSDSRPYTDFPEFDEIVSLGKPALPAIAREIEANSDMAIFLGEAIIQITGWKGSDLNIHSLQDLNRALIKRLRSEELIPDKS